MFEKLNALEEKYEDLTRKLSDPDVIAHGVSFLCIVSYYLVAGGLTITLTGIHRGAGDTIPPMFSGLIKLILLIALANIFATSMNLGVRGVWFALLVSYFVEAIVLGIVFLSGRWSRKGLQLLHTIDAGPKTV